MASSPFLQVPVFFFFFFFFVLSGLHSTQTQTQTQTQLKSSKLVPVGLGLDFEKKVCGVYYSHSIKHLLHTRDAIFFCSWRVKMETVPWRRHACSIYIFTSFSPKVPLCSRWYLYTKRKRAVVFARVSLLVLLQPFLPLLFNVVLVLRCCFCHYITALSFPIFFWGGLRGLKSSLLNQERMAKKDAFDPFQQGS